VATLNGGIYRTANFGTSSPTWVRSSLPDTFGHSIASMTRDASVGVALLANRHHLRRTERTTLTNVRALLC
jgi:hypothetical protein